MNRLLCYKGTQTELMTTKVNSSVNMGFSYSFHLVIFIQMKIISYDSILIVWSWPKHQHSTSLFHCKVCLWKSCPLNRWLFSYLIENLVKWPSEIRICRKSSVICKIDASQLTEPTGIRPDYGRTICRNPVGIRPYFVNRISVGAIRPYSDRIISIGFRSELYGRSPTVMSQWLNHYITRLKGWK